MARKAICLYKRDDELAAVVEKLDENCKLSQERKAFIDKALKDLMEDHKKRSQEIWRELEACLVSKGYVNQDFHHKTDGLEIDHEAGVIYHYKMSDLEKKEESSFNAMAVPVPDGIMEVIKQMFDKKP